MIPNLSVEALAELQRLVRELEEEKDPQKLLERVMDSALNLTKAERGFLIRVAPGVGMDVRVARNLRKEYIEHPKFQVSRGVILEALKTGRPVLLEDAKEDEGFGGRRSVASMRLASVACVPLQAGHTLLGVLYLDNRYKPGIFRAEHGQLLQAFAARAAAVIAANPA